MIACVVLGLLALCGTGECVITGWTTPLLASGADIDGGIEYEHEGATGTLYTFLALSGGTTITYTIAATTPVVFAVGSTTGLLTVTTGVLDGAATTLSYVVKVTATDNASPVAVGTATLTISILPARFNYGFACAYIVPAATTGGGVITNALSSASGTDTIAFASGNTNTDFAVDAVGAVTTAKAITTASGPYTLVITGVDAIGTFSTATSTVSVCVRDTSCTCSLSAGSHITAGLLGMFAAVIMMLLK